MQQHLNCKEIWYAIYYFAVGTTVEQHFSAVWLEYFQIIGTSASEICSDAVKDYPFIQFVFL